MLSGRLSLWLLVLGILTASAVLPALSQTKTNITGTGGIHQIKGKIYLPSGLSYDSPIDVELQSTTDATLKVTTDVSGSFAFVNLAPGAYTVVVKAGEQFEIAKEYVLIDDEIQGPVRVGQRPKIFTVPMYLQLKRGFGVEKKAAVVDAKWSNISKDAIHQLDIGNQALRDKQMEKAEADFKKAIDIAPNFAPAYTALGKLCLSRGRLDEAVSNLHMAIRYDEADFDARLTIGIAFLNQSELDGALRELGKAASLNSAAVTPRYYLGVVYVQKKNIDAAQKELETAKQLIGSKSFPLLHRYLGGVYVAKQMNKEAVAELETYIKQDPQAKDGDRIRQTIADLKTRIN